MGLENFPQSESAKRMLSYVTKGWYDNSYIGKWLYEIMGAELDEARKRVEELPYQLFVETATWGLAYHELKWGLPVMRGLTYEERRKLIYRMRDERAPLNPYRMEMILKNLTGREAHIDDSFGPANSFTVEFEPGEEPIDLAAVIWRLNEIKQSHVVFKVNATSKIEEAQIHAAIGSSLVYRSAAIMDGYTVMEEDIRVEPVNAGLAINVVSYRPATITDGYTVEEAIQAAPIYVGGNIENIHRSAIVEKEE